MDVRKTAREIGLFETAINLSFVINSEEVIQKVGASMPLPDENIADMVGKTAEWLLSFGKSKYMFFMPEIALIEEIIRRGKDNTEIIIAVPCDLDQEAKERLRNNLPHGDKVAILEEPYFPQSFYPSNGLMVISGYIGGNRPMVLADSYRMVEHYGSFLGKTVFVPYTELDTATRYDDWMEISRQRISAEWRWKI